MAKWKPVPGHIMTRWAKEISPEKVWTEYPRPQMTRTEWVNLNGPWKYAITQKGHDQPEFESEILVPFPIESALSGVKKELLPDEWLWYRRSFQIPSTWSGKRILLHFGAVDWEASVWLNGVVVGSHQGGYTPFSFDITDQLVEGNNQLVVSVWDPSDQSWIGRGKQVTNPDGIWYTAVSGIWQTVWLEPVEETYIQHLKITPDIDQESLYVEVTLGGFGQDIRLVATAFEEENQVAVGSNSAGETIQLPIIDPILWTPETPYLYNLEVEVFQGGRKVDQVGSYFGMRKFSLGADPEGRMRLLLNNKPIFHYGPLDQGYWPDGLYTAPNEDAMRYDIEICKQYGFNMLRKHIKVEPARYYYDCDRLGIIVWQDMVNGGKHVGALTSTLAILFGGMRRKDNRLYWKAGRSRQASREDYWRELQEIVDHLYNFTCIGMWVPFNEAWGQFDANKVADWLKEYDPTRPVDHASGWYDQGGGDFSSIHTYVKDLKPVAPDPFKEGGRAVILSEFGGYALKLDGVLWDPDKVYGYKKYSTNQELTEAYINLLEEQLIPWIKMGLSGAVYTQTTDVETEINGFLTYDREVVKIDIDQVAKVHASLFET
jgi:beta-galactosidase/beta-glucuronidase